MNLLLVSGLLLGGLQGNPVNIPSLYLVAGKAVRVLAFCPDVQRDLGLDSKQKASLERVLVGFSGPAAIPADNSDAARELAAQVYLVLRQRQRKRLVQILYQSDPLTAYTTLGVGHALHLTKVQNDWMKFLKLKFDRMEGEHTVVGMKDQLVPIRKGGPIIDHWDLVNSNYASGQASSILTSRQKAAWRRITGRPFKGHCPLCQRYWHPRRT
jgi:hypothetical protein